MGELIYHCYCTGVTQRRVLQAIASGARSVDEIRHSTGACTGCQSCRPELEQLLAAVEAGRIALPRPVHP